MIGTPEFILTQYSEGHQKNKRGIRKFWGGRNHKCSQRRIMNLLLSHVFLDDQTVSLLVEYRQHIPILWT